MAMSRSLGSTSFIRLPPMTRSPSEISSRPAIIQQRGGLAAAGGADQDDELLVRNLQVEVVNRGHLVVIDLLHILQGYSCHVQGRKGQCLRKYPLARGRASLCGRYGRSPHCRTAGPGGRSSFLTAPPPYENGVGSEGLNFGARLYKRRQSSGNSYQSV